MISTSVHQNTPELQAKSDSHTIKVDLAESIRFFSLLAEDETVTFQTFDDSKRKNVALTRVFHGDLDSCAQELIDLNNQGAGIFVTINATDGQGRTAANITKVRAVFVDLDGSPLEPVMAAPITPHIVIKTSPGKFHAYWLVEGCPKESFMTIQKQLANRFNGDSQVCDLPRVMRLPGFLHQKQAPFLTHILLFKA